MNGWIKPLAIPVAAAIIVSWFTSFFAFGGKLERLDERSLQNEKTLILAVAELRDMKNDRIGLSGIVGGLRSDVTSLNSNISELNTRLRRLEERGAFRPSTP